MTVNVEDLVFNSEAVAKPKKDSGMTIVFDPTRKRSTHVESGLAVQWVRDEPPMERRTHFKLIVGGAEVPFEASYDFGRNKIKEKYPDADVFEIDRLTTALREMNYTAVNIRAQFDKEVFVKVWQNLVQQGPSVYRVSTYYTEFAGLDPSSRKDWSCEG
jgi:hypothetical protein